VSGASPDLALYLPLTGGTLSGPGNSEIGGTLRVHGDSHIANLHCDISINANGAITAQAHMNTQEGMYANGLYPGTGYSLIAQNSTELRSDAQINGNIRLHGSFYMPNASDPLRVYFDPGNYGRINYTVGGVRTWTAGVGLGGEFMFADESAQTVRMVIGVAGANVDIHGGAWVGGRLEVGDFQSHGNVLANGWVQSSHGSDMHCGWNCYVIASHVVGGNLDNYFCRIDPGSPDPYLRINYGQGAIAFKPGGGQWGGTLAAEARSVKQPYTRGLAEVRQLHTMHCTAGDYIVLSLDHERARTVMPEMYGELVTHRWRAEDPEPTKEQTFDCTALTYALVNAVQELAAQSDTLKKA
jgi:hypothetical protein